MKYAHSKFIPFVALCGSNEITENTIMIKDMETGEQTSYSYEELLKLLQ
jgi:histidyl-tRNA synthetase